ncbi:MAG: DnaD domain protein [Chloroflexota bacterium]|nr:DnaD domain protein [Chloroflexota bacterium]
MSFNGFPPSVRYFPIPAPVFGPLLEEIDTLGELKTVIRVLWMIQQKKGPLKLVTQNEILADRTLVNALSKTELITASIQAAVSRGIFIKVQHENGSIGYMTNTDFNRRSAGNFGISPNESYTLEPEPWEAAEILPGIYSLYEQNIGILTPIIGEQIGEAEEKYPAVWITDAIKESASQNKRSWAYISGILERWHREGRDDGEPSRRTSKSRYI